MDMKIRKTLMALLIALFINLFFAGLFSFAFGSTSGSEDIPMPPLSMFHKMGLSGICGDQEHLYVMAGGKIMIYQLSDMALLRSVDLPEPVPPPGAPPKTTDPRPFPPFPPPVAGPHGLWSDDHFLYVLAGPRIYEYTIPDLVLLNTVELPKPELQKPGN